MADHQIFLAEMENYKQQSFSLADIELSSYSAIPSSGFISLPLHNQYQLPESFHVDHAHRKRKSMPIVSCTSPNSSPQLSDNVTNSVERKKKSKKEGKSTEVVHVRAKRGQATDSHSLAERVRREKINERLRCLQDIVPGCYKTMGMAVMLDEIINYVQSLQNQVEFLSMKLTAASAFHDFNSDEDALEIMQRAKIHNGVTSETTSAQFGPLGFNFEYCPQFPHNT